MTMIYDPVIFVKLVQKILVGNYEPIMRICGQIFIINLHNLQMLFLLRIKNKLSECLASLHKHKDPQWKTFWRRFCPGPQTRGQLTPHLFCAPQILLCSEKCVSNIWYKLKSFPHKNVFCPQTWLRAWFCQNCVCIYNILFWSPFGLEM